MVESFTPDQSIAGSSYPLWRRTGYPARSDVYSKELSVYPATKFPPVFAPVVNQSLFWIPIPITIIHS